MLDVRELHHLVYGGETSSQHLGLVGFRDIVPLCRASELERLILVNIPSISSVSEAARHTIYEEPAHPGSK